MPNSERPAVHPALAAADTCSEIEFRQLRHHTRNALARILAQVSSELSSNAAARRVALEVERRVLLTAEISDALFGLTRAPGPFPTRLAALCESVVGLMGEDGQCLAVTCDVAGVVPPAQEETVLRIAHEFVGNAVKHGMHVRLVGNIEVKVVASSGGTLLTVADDGWGCGKMPRPGEGMTVSAALAAGAGGAVGLTRETGWTVATLQLPQAAPPPARTAACGTVTIG